MLVNFKYKFATSEMIMSYNIYFETIQSTRSVDVEWTGFSLRERVSNLCGDENCCKKYISWITLLEILLI